MATRKEQKAEARARRKAVVKAYGDGSKVSFADIAEQLGISRQRVQAMHAKARRLGEVKG